jgi:hypothetical protein
MARQTRDKHAAQRAVQRYHIPCREASQQQAIIKAAYHTQSKAAHQPVTKRKHTDKQQKNTNSIPQYEAGQHMARHSVVLYVELAIVPTGSVGHHITKLQGNAAYPHPSQHTILQAESSLPTYMPAHS